MRKKLLHIYDSLVRPFLYAVREWWPFWYNILNKKARDLYRSHPVTLSPLEQKLVAELSRNGIVTTTIDELFGKDFTLEELKDYAKNLPPPERDEVAMKKEVFQSRQWPIHPVLDYSNPFLRLTLDQRVFNIAHAYMKMWTKLKYYDLALTHVVSQDAQAQYSQRWHRDPEEKRMVKLFIYLTDVDESCGPFTFVLGSVWGMKPYGHLFPQKPPVGSYMDDTTFDKEVPKEAQRMMTGRAGTIILCDTSGLHKGGYATKGERLMFTAFYAAPSHSDDVWYSPKDGSSLPENASKEVSYALTHTKD